MDGGKNHRGSASRRLGTSNYLLELFPDIQHGEAARYRAHSEGFSSQSHLTQSRMEEARLDLFTGAQSMQWGREERLPPGAVTKCRLSRSKRRPPLDTSSTEPTHAKDHVIFTESPVAPGVPVVYRPPEERAVNPDRLNLDRRHLMVCPILEGEDRLRLLNLQHNAITRLLHLSNLRRLVFLDLYDNLVHEIAGLEGLLSLRVLMLGKNRIRRISGLQTLVKLDVLDLHGNMIREVENLSHLVHLRVLNLAGNEITCVSQLTGLQALTELNLRRNRITLVYEVDELPNLQRLFLSHNLVQNFDDVACLSHCETLSELTLDGNPLANAPDHRSSIIYHTSHLKMLDQRLITEEERSEAMATAREEEERLKELHRLAQMQEHKEAAIAAVRRAWEASHEHLSSQVLGGSVSMQSFAGSAAFMRRSKRHPLRSSSLPRLVPSYFVDHSGPTLHLYGSGALEALDSPSHGPQPVQDLHFHYMEFDDIVPWLPKIIHACPEINSLSFECTNVAGLEQVNALATINTPLQSLTISSWGNPITQHSLFPPYTFYRLHHLGLAELNGATLSNKDRTTAERIFGRLGELTTSSLPQTRLLAFISKYRPRSTGSRRSTLPHSDSLKRSVVCQEPLNRIALHYHSPQSDSQGTAGYLRQDAAKVFCSRVLSSTLATHRKTQLLEQLWPKILANLVHQTLEEYHDIDQHMQTLLDSL